MGLIDRLREDLKDATRSGDDVRKSGIRLAIAALKNAEIEKMSALTDEEEIEVVARQAKMSRESIEEFTKAGRVEAAEAEKGVLKVLESYLPKQLSEEEIRSIVSSAIAAVGASGPKDMGKLMGAVMPKVRGKADGKLVNRVVKEMLGA